MLGIFVRVPTAGIPYSLVVLSGLLPWTYVSNSVARASSSMITNAPLLTKVYFPRLVVPVSVVFSNLMTFGIQFALSSPTAAVNQFQTTVYRIRYGVVVQPPVAAAMGY